MLYVSKNDRAPIDDFRKYIYKHLKENKLKYSDQREMVLKILHSQNYPVSVDFLVNKLNEETEGIGYATVSRHLKFFQKLNILITVNKTKNSYLLKKCFDGMEIKPTHQNLSVEDAKSILTSRDYGVCYEPIIRVSDKSIFAYEALSRFKYKNTLLPPDIFFKAIHDDVEEFFSAEIILKEFQLKHRVTNKKIFLNLDPDVCVEDKKIKLWVDLLKSNNDLVVEIIENSDEESITNIEYFMKWLKENHLEFAYDDYGKPNSIFFPSLLHESNYVKLDIFFIETIRKNPSYFEIMQGIVKYTKRKGQYTILEGVETEEDLEIAREVGVDFVQGYLFKNKFISKWKKEESCLTKSL